MKAGLSEGIDERELSKVSIYGYIAGKTRQLSSLTGKQARIVSQQSLAGWQYCLSGMVMKSRMINYIYQGDSSYLQASLYGLSTPGPEVA